MQQRLGCIGGRSVPLVGGHVVASTGPRIQLSRTADTLCWVLDHLLPLADPANGTGYRKEHRKHVRGKAHSLQDDARVKIDIWIELLAYKIIVLKCYSLQFHREIQQWVVLDPQLLQHLVTGALHDLCPRIIIFVHPMTEAHQAHMAVLVLHPSDEFRDA